MNYGPPADLLSELVIETDDIGLHQYGPVSGSHSLRQIIREKLATDNSIEVESLGNIIVTAGANMGFLNALLAITCPGDEIILLAPYYFNHHMAVTMLSCTAVAVATDAQHQPDLERIEAAISSKTRAIVTVSPNNPSGAVYSREMLSKINTLCKERGIYHISDEAYEYFHYSPSKHFSPASLEGAQTHTISLFSLSKSYGIAGWRIGYMLIPDTLRAAISKAQDTNLICANRLAQRLARDLMLRGHGFCRDQSKYLETNRNICSDGLGSLGDKCHYTLPQGAFYVFIKLDCALSSEQVSRTLIKQSRVALLPGTTFGMTDGCYLRISYGALSPEQCTVAVERLQQGLGRIVRD